MTENLVSVGELAAKKILIDMSPGRSTWGDSHGAAWRDLVEYEADLANTINDVLQSTLLGVSVA